MVATKFAMSRHVVVHTNPSQRLPWSKNQLQSWPWPLYCPVNMPVEYRFINNVFPTLCFRFVRFVRWFGWMDVLKQRYSSLPAPGDIAWISPGMGREI